MQAKQQFLSLITKHKHLLLIMLAVSVYFYKLGIFILSNSQFYYYWDWQGHIDKALKLSWIPWNSGWDTTFWGGYTTLTYPNLSHYLLKIFISLFETHTGLVIFLIFLFGIQIYAFYKLARNYSNNKNETLISFLLLVLVSLSMHGKYLGSFLGTLTTGGFSANLGISLLILLITTRNLYKQALFCGLIILTHSLSAVIGIIYFLIAVGIKISRKEIRSSGIIAPIMVLAIGSPWLIPFFDISFKGASENISGGEIIVPALIATFALIKTIINKKRHPIDILLIVLSIFVMLPEKSMFELKKVGVSGLHLYRFIFPLFLLSAASLWSSVIHPRFLTKKSAHITLTIVLLILISLQSVPYRNFKFEFDDTEISNLSGRVLNVTSAAVLPDYPHLFEEILSRLNENIVGSQGLFYESSQRGLQFYELANHLQPNTFKNGTFGIFFNNRDGKPWKEIDTFATAQLLGINYVVYVERPKEDREYGTVFGNIYDNQNLVYEIVYEKYPENTLAVTLSTNPIVNQNLNLGTWWLDTNHKELMMVEKPLLNEGALNLDQPPVHITNISPQRIKIRIDSALPAPTIVKFTHNKYWSAFALDSESSTTAPYWVTPGNILVYAQGNIELKWNPPTYLKYCYYLSFFGIGYTLYKSQTKKNRGQ
jgi:hypothetical protein